MNFPGSDTGRRNFIFVPYSYVVVSNAINHGASNMQPLLLDQDADFELHEVTGFADADVATEYRPNRFSVQITDKNNSRIWSSGQVAIVTMLPWTLRRPVLLAKRSNLNINFQNITAATDNMICTLVMHGYKVYLSAAPAIAATAAPVVTG